MTIDLKRKKVFVLKIIVVLIYNEFNSMPKIIFIINKNVKNKENIVNLLININIFIMIFKIINMCLKSNLIYKLTI